MSEHLIFGEDGRTSIYPIDDAKLCMPNAKQPLDNQAEILTANTIRYMNLARQSAAEDWSLRDAQDISVRNHGDNRFKGFGADYQ